MAASDVHELRVLIFAPVGRDAALTRDLLERASLQSYVCSSLTELCAEIERGAGAVLLTEEALDDARLPELGVALEGQPAWSDISVLLFSGHDRTQAALRTLRLLEVLRNVTLLDRPVRVAAVISTLRAALRGRQRQYQLRDVLVELHAAREEAERANRLKDEFLATLSHELRTPLNAILGWLSMLRRRHADPERTERILAIIERNAQAQAQLVNEVLDVSRMVRGRLVVERRPVNLKEIVLHAVDSVRPEAEAKHLSIGLEVSDDLTPVLGDPERLQQVFWNLLSNAVKFTPDRGRIDVTLGRAGSHLEVAVSDTGAGLSPDFLPFAFERFRQGDQSFTRKHGGLGLGLAIVKHLVDMHGGDVSAESAGPGLGATFRVRLPVPVVTAIDRPGERSDGEATADFGDQLILVVDDDQSTRELLTELLTEHRARVAAVDSARAAMESFAREVPALLVADLGMPEEDGVALMQRVRALPENRGGLVPSLALSAYTRGQDKARALGAGFDDFLAKPALPADVLRAVNRLLTLSAHAAVRRA
jgi:signal transduction histidine kinase/ActR/RegA family two-component response regulator